MKTFATTLFLSIPCIGFACSASIEYLEFVLQGEIPSAEEINHLYNNKLISPAFQDSAHIDKSGNFENDRTTSFSFPSAFDSKGAIKEIKKKNLGHKMTGHASKSEGVYSVEFTFLDLQQDGYKLYRIKNDRIIPQPVFRQHSVETSVTLIPGQEWTILGGLKSEEDKRLLLAIRVKE